MYQILKSFFFWKTIDSIFFVIVAFLHQFVCILSNLKIMNTFLVICAVSEQINPEIITYIGMKEDLQKVAAY